MDAKIQIYARLGALGIPLKRLEHDEAHTMDDLKEVMDQLDCVIPKNLFLAPRNQSHFYLCLVMPDAPFRTADISKQIISSRLSFASAEKMREMLRTHPGALSPMGLIFESARAVTLLVDERLKDEAYLGFHPNDNRETLAMAGADFFQKFLPAAGHEPHFVRL